MTKDQTSPEYLDELALAVGRVIIAFTQIEHTVTMIIAEILGLNEVQERALVRPMSISNKTSVLRLLAKQGIKPAKRDSAVKTLRMVDDAADSRNDLAHGFYGHKAGRLAILSFSGSAKLTGNPIYWTPEKLGEFLKALSLLRLSVSLIRDDFSTIPLKPKTHHSIRSSAETK